MIDTAFGWHWARKSNSSLIIHPRSHGASNHPKRQGRDAEAMDSTLGRAPLGLRHFISSPVRDSEQGAPMPMKTKVILKILWPNLFTHPQRKKIFESHP